ncbi:hypothetical protein WR25_22467 [Diploscapter pachys]|uniref:Uncharacterized protein n=1 Tax=Diploscapter pachys TaxID=2018661 RepID=A0A2A2KDK7_9BILA|nr:hypothetical protein WR25_22467 [Diploscapter pachys]
MPRFLVDYNKNAKFTNEKLFQIYQDWQQISAKAIDPDGNKSADDYRKDMACYPGPRLNIARSDDCLPRIVTCDELFSHYENSVNETDDMLAELMHGNETNLEDDLQTILANETMRLRCLDDILPAESVNAKKRIQDSIRAGASLLAAAGTAGFVQVLDKLKKEWGNASHNGMGMNAAWRHSTLSPDLNQSIAHTKMEKRETQRSTIRKKVFATLKPTTRATTPTPSMKNTTSTMTATSVQANSPSTSAISTSSVPNTANWSSPPVTVPGTASMTQTTPMNSTTPFFNNGIFIGSSTTNNLMPQTQPLQTATPSSTDSASNNNSKLKKSLISLVNSNNPVVEKVLNAVGVSQETATNYIEKLNTNDRSIGQEIQSLLSSANSGSTDNLQLIDRVKSFLTSSSSSVSNGMSSRKRRDAEQSGIDYVIDKVQNMDASDLNRLVAMAKEIWQKANGNESPPNNSNYPEEMNGNDRFGRELVAE